MVIKIELVVLIAEGRRHTESGEIGGAEEAAVKAVQHLGHDVLVVLTTPLGGYRMTTVDAYRGGL